MNTTHDNPIEQIHLSLTEIPTAASLREVEVGLVQWFGLAGAQLDFDHVKILKIAGLGWAHVELLVKQKAKLEQERDDARRALCSAIVSEHYSQIDHLLVAAMKWGRTEALRLYPESILRVIYGEYACDDEDLAVDIAEAHRRLDQRFPPEAST